MKIWTIFLLIAGLPSVLLAQTREVTLQQGLPVVKYRLSEKESSYEVYKRFGMDEASFLLLNSKPEDTSSVPIDDDTIFLAVKDALLMQCSEPACVSVVYTAAEGDNFKKIGSYFGNLNPYLIKQLNPQLEAVTAGKAVKVGYLPASLFTGEGVQDTTAPEAVTTVQPARPAAPVADTASKPATGDTPYSGAGYYASEFREPAQNKNTGKVGNFKSFGGWYDGKFYLLINGVELGKVVKVTNLQNGSYVFAKVVSPLPAVKSEKPLLARLNNAACAALDIWDDAEFEAEISY